MSTEPMSLYKLIILHILHRASLSLTQGVVLDVITTLGYTDYIQAQSSLGELIEAEMVEEKNTYHRSYITLTETGEKTRLLFEDRISPDIRREIDEYLKENHVETLDETSLVSDYRLTKDGMYIATCSLRDGSHILYEITLEVSSEEEAVRVCNSWEKNSETLYAQALKTLLN